jgi:hypothetical protein
MSDSRGWDNHFDSGSAMNGGFVCAIGPLHIVLRKHYWATRLVRKLIIQTPVIDKLISPYADKNEYNNSDNSYSTLHY